MYKTSCCCFVFCFFLSSPPSPSPVLLILFGSAHSSAGGNVARLVQPWTVTPLTQVQFPGAAREFFSRVNFQCRLSDVVRALSCAIACINICADSKDPVVHVRVRWIMETLKHAARTVGWVARLRRRWLSPWKSTLIFHGRNPVGRYSWRRIGKVQSPKRWLSLRWLSLSTLSSSFSIEPWGGFIQPDNFQQNE